MLAGIVATVAAAMVLGIGTWIYKSFSGGDKPDSGAVAGAPAQVAPSTTPSTRTSSTTPTSVPTSLQTPAAAPTGPRPGPAEERYLADLTPLLGTSIPTPVRFGSTEQPRSVKVNCGPSGTSNFVEWATDGAATLTALVGIPDDERAAGAHASILVEDQDQHQVVPPFNVSLGAPRTLQRVPLGRTVQLRIECISIDNQDPGAERLFRAGLGNAALTP